MHCCLRGGAVARNCSLKGQFACIDCTGTRNGAGSYHSIAAQGYLRVRHSRHQIAIMSSASPVEVLDTPVAEAAWASVSAARHVSYTSEDDDGDDGDEVSSANPQAYSRRSNSHMPDIVPVASRGARTLARGRNGRRSAPPVYEGTLEDAQSAISQIRSLARQSVEKNKETVALAQDMNRGLSELSKRIRRGGVETQDQRLKREGSNVEKFRDELAKTIGLRIKREKRLTACTDRLRVANSGVVATGSPRVEERMALTLSAQLETARDEYQHLSAFAGTLSLIYSRSRKLRSGSKRRAEQLQKVLAKSVRDIETMKQALHTLHEARDTAARARGDYLRGFVRDQLTYKEKIQGRKQMIALDNQIDQHQKATKAARDEAQARPRKQRELKAKKINASNLFKKGALGRAKAEQRASAQQYSAAMRRIEMATGVREPDLLVERFECLHGERESNVHARESAQRRLEDLRVQKAGLLQTKDDVIDKYEARSVRGNSGQRGTSAIDSAQLRLLVVAKEKELIQRKAADREKRLIGVREALLWLLVRLSPECGGRSPRKRVDSVWAREAWQRGPTAILSDIASILEAMATTVSRNPRGDAGERLRLGLGGPDLDC